MHSFLRPLLVSAALASFIAGTACSPTTAEQANRAAERLLTAVASATATSLDASPSARLEETQPSQGATPTPDLPPIFARCITRAALVMYIEPSTTADVVTQLKAREVFTAYGRTRNAKWVIGWTTNRDYGWVSTERVGCSVPIIELKPTDPQLLVRITPTPEVVAMAERPTATTLPSPSTEEPSPPSAASSPSLALISETPLPTPESVATSTSTPIPVSGDEQDKPSFTKATAPPATEVSLSTSPLRLVLRTGEPFTLQLSIEGTPYLLTLLLEPQPRITPTPQPFGFLICRVSSTSNVNVRAAPSREAARVSTLAPGRLVQTFGQSADGSWLLVRLDGVRGWVIAEALQCEGDRALLPINTP